MQIVSTVTIKRPANQIFSYLTNSERLQEWQAFLVKADQVSQGAIQVGTRFRNILQHPGFNGLGALRVVVNGEIINYEPDRLLELRGNSDITNLTIRYTLDEIDGETFTTCHFHMSCPKT